MSPRLPRTQPEPQSPSEATTPLLRPRVALALLVALLLVALTVQIADARLPRARPYRVGGPIGLDTNLLSESGASAWAIDAYLDATTRLPHLGAAFMAAERTYGINARFLLAAALHESGWGRSYLARVRHNLFGFNAIDRDPGVANRYPTYEAGIDQTARFIRESYLTPGGRWWAGQPTLRAMQLSWSTSHGWGLSVSGLASGMRLDTFGGSSIAFASPTVSGILHPGETAAVDLHWTGDAIPREVEFAATWQPVA
ncbi:MAG TPA: glucosaminidase domain-containing protein, partial [Candidatus Dormibacteraeota bacterium]|nr:glucosaminidase domain-containing protein [Candidatus Dormibacteraeota bacterium]